MNREVHAPFWEGPGVQSLRPTQHQLHWSLDVIFGEDARRLTEDNGPQNFSLLTKMALNLLRQQPPEGKTKSLRLRRKRIGWDDDARMALLGLLPL